MLIVCLTQILVPYVRAKAHDWYEQLGGGADADLFSQQPRTQNQQQQIQQVSTRHHSVLVVLLLTPPSTRSQLPLRERVFSAVRNGFKAGYPYANMAYEVVLLTWNIRYLFDRSPYWRPWLSLMGVDVRRMSADDYVSHTRSLPHILWAESDFACMIAARRTNCNSVAPAFSSPAALVWFAAFVRDDRRPLARLDSAALVRSAQGAPAHVHLLLPIP